MKKEDFIKIFDLEELYYKKEQTTPFLYNFTDLKNHSDNFITFYFYNDEFSIYLNTKNFSLDNLEKELKLTFHIVDEQLQLSKGNNEFINEVFPHLTFDNNIKSDLEFVAGTINNVLIKTYDMDWSYKKL